MRHHPQYAHDGTGADQRPGPMEDMHKDLFQSLWTDFNIEEYKSERIARYEYRL